MGICAFLEGPRAATAGDLSEAMELMRGAVPRWARQHPEFEGEAGLCLATALKQYDSTKGMPFEWYLRMVSNSRIQTRLARYDGVRYDADGEDLPRPLPLDEAPEVIDAQPGPEDCLVATDGLRSFVEHLPPLQRHVALMLANGVPGKEIAKRLGVSKQSVSNAIAAMRRGAAIQAIVEAPMAG